MPKRDIIFNASCERAWMRIVPGSISICPAFDLKVIVACQPLPKTQGERLALPQILAMDCVRRKVVVPLDHKTLLTLSKCDTIPTGFRHQRGSLLTFYLWCYAPNDHT